MEGENGSATKHTIAWEVLRATSTTKWKSTSHVSPLWGYGIHVTILNKNDFSSMIIARNQIRRQWKIIEKYKQSDNSENIFYNHEKTTIECLIKFFHDSFYTTFLVGHEANYRRGISFWKRKVVIKCPPEQHAIKIGKNAFLPWRFLLKFLPNNNEKRRENGFSMTSASGNYPAADAVEVKSQR